MKKSSLLCLAVLFALLLPALLPFSSEAAEGRKSVRFDGSSDLNDDFYLCSELENTGFYVRDGYLYATGKTESKAVLKEPADLSSFTLEADFYPVSDISPLDAGFYVYASAPASKLDGIRAYNINLERGAKSNSMTVKIHRFVFGYAGEIAAKEIPVKSFPVQLKVHADEGNIKVYVNGGTDAVLDVDLPKWEPGRVGFRVFRGAPVKIGNFRLTSPELPVDKAELNLLIGQAEKLDASAYTSASYTELSAVLSAAQTLETDEQTEIDVAQKALRKALENLVPKDDFTGLSAKISQARELLAAGENRYTFNTITSLKLVLERATKLSEASGEDDISEMSAILKTAMEGLTAYNQ